MDFSVYQSKLSKVSARLNLMVALVFTLMLSNIILATLAFYEKLNAHVIITPFNASNSFTYSTLTVDASYLKLMSENFIYTLLNVNPETIAKNHKHILDFVDAKTYASFQTKLMQDAAIIQKNKISSNFVIKDIKLDTKNLTAVIHGTLTRFVGNAPLKIIAATYELTYNYHLGHLSILSFKKIKGEKHA